jgi:hypothetical protein
MVSLVVAVFAAIVMAPAAAHAEPYPAETPPASVSDGTVEPGGTVTFSGSGFKPFEKISIEVGYSGSDSRAAYRTGTTGGFVLAAARRATITTTADGNGNFSIEVPLTEVGTATLTAVGLTSGKTVTSVVEVAPPSDDNGDNDKNGDNDGNDSEVSLPTTGPAHRPLVISVAGGMGAILIGAALVWISRGRRRDTEI